MVGCTPTYSPRSSFPSEAAAIVPDLLKNRTCGPIYLSDEAAAEPYLAERPEYAPQPLPKPSFNCAIAGLEAEKLICGSAELARLDVELAEIYDRTIGRAREYDRAYGPVSSQVAFITLVQDQRSWIQNQRNRCRTEQCLSSAYQMRINYLSGYSFR